MDNVTAIGKKCRSENYHRHIGHSDAYSPKCTTAILHLGLLRSKSRVEQRGAMAATERPNSALVPTAADPGNGNTGGVAQIQTQLGGVVMDVPGVDNPELGTGYFVPPKTGRT